MSAHIVSAKWFNGYWHLSCIDYPHIVLETKSLAKAEILYRQAIRKSLQQADITVHIQPELTEDVSELIDSAAALRIEAETTKEAGNALWSEGIQQLYQDGWSVRDIGFVVGLSHQRISQILRELVAS